MGSRQRFALQHLRVPSSMICEYTLDSSTNSIRDTWDDRKAVVTFIDYTAASDTESELFLDETMAEAGDDGKVHRIVQATALSGADHWCGCREYSLGQNILSEDVTTAADRVTSIAAGYMDDAAMVTSEKKGKAMHIHPTTTMSRA